MKNRNFLNARGSSRLFLTILLLLSVSQLFGFGQAIPDTYNSEYQIYLKDHPNTKLTYPEYFAISSYKNMDYSSYNTYLRTGEIYGEHTPVRLKYMLSGMKKLPPVKIVTYRGTSFEVDPDLFAYYTKIGQIVSDPGFTSTSVSREIAESFIADNGYEYFILMIIKGFSGRDLAGIGYIGVDKAEREILFLPGTKFRITKTRKIKITMPDYGLENSSVTEVTLEEVKD